jgi:hypothetical protein
MVTYIFIKKIRNLYTPRKNDNIENVALSHFMDGSGKFKVHFRHKKYSPLIQDNFRNIHKCVDTTVIVELLI